MIVASEQAGSSPLPKVAIIVLNFNTSHLTDALAHYLNIHLNYANKKVYIIDNGSSTAPSTATHKLPQNLGFTNGIYQGYLIASQEGKYDAYWFLNSDVGFEYGNDVLLHLVDVLFSSHNYAQIAPQHNSPHKFMEHSYQEAQPVPYLEPTATLIKSSTIEALGFWDLNLTYGWGVDYDYGYRIRTAGLKNILTNRARIIHKEHQSIANLSDYIQKASAEMNAVLRQKYGEDWGRIMMMERSFVPLILTCDRDLSITEKFVSSYKTVQSGLGKPVVVIDISSSPKLSTRYISLIASIDPKTIYIHSRENDMSIYDSVQEAVNSGLQKVLEETKSDDNILFLEDDIIFSSQFIKKLYSLGIHQDTGFISLYLPDGEYGSLIIDPNRFYGTQCVLFLRKVLEEIVNNYEYIKSHIPPGYDIRWSRFLAERGYKLYCTDYSYVQHIPAISRLHGHNSHISTSFLK
jgi:hypothetical protein